MANVLNLKRIFGPPFNPKPFSLRGMTNGAIPLFAVLPIKRMSFFAVRLLGVEVRDRRTIFHRVFVSGNTLKVLMVNAGRVAASVIYNHPFLNWAEHIKPRNPMRPSSLSSQVKGSVSVLIQGRRPDDAAVLTRCSFGHKSGIFNICKVHGLLLNGPKGYMDTKGKSTYGMG